MMVAENNLGIVEAYYKAMDAKEADTVAGHLHPEVQFIGPLANLSGKDAVLEAVKGFMSMIKGIRIRAKFASENQAMLAYDADFGSAIGICRAAVLMSFEDDLIRRIELFYDARPFDSEKDTPFKSR